MSVITSNNALNELLSNLVVTQKPIDNQIYNEIMSYVMGKDMEHADQLNKWIKNCDLLMRKLNENN